MAETEESWRRWVPVADTLLNQAYYRVLSFVSFHAPLMEAYTAIESLVEKRGGRLYWVMEDRIARWDDLEVWPGVKMSLWIFGGPRNTVYARVGWYKLYFLDVAVKGLARTFGTLQE